MPKLSAQLANLQLLFLLEALARHLNPIVRRASAKTLTLICDPIAIPTLLEGFLHEEDKELKKSSVYPCFPCRAVGNW